MLVDITRGIDPVGLDRHDAHGCFHVPGVDADHRQTSGGQAVAQPGRQRPRLDANPLESQSGRGPDPKAALRAFRSFRQFRTFIYGIWKLAFAYWQKDPP
jgi:hypothetical protein